ncbi:MFS transporter [Sphingobium tyrosinilyticum]|uniref:MFS transporter n=2 Tax=Sphingobium tyrosinilyticum TaxID=2715436 RepID=A0ABV9F1R7_9SPHN
MLGVAGTGLFSMSSGVFMDEMIREFGWSRTEFSSAMTAYVIVGLIGLPILGRAIDRFGSRAVALAGLLPTVAGMSLLGLTNGNVWQWRFFILIQALGILIISVPVWITAVIARFRASRGLAIAVALAGTGLGSATWPILAAFYVEHFGWRLAFPALALSWAVLTVPLTLLFFHDSGRRTVSAISAITTPKPPIGPVLLSRTFLCLAASGGLFIGASYGLLMHFVPILRWSGHDLATSAMIAGVTGVCTILGRILTGFLLDLLPTRWLGMCVFLLPIGTSLLLLQAGSVLPAALAAAILLGLSTGAETDILTYIAARRFDQAVFGSIYSVIQSVFAGMSVGGSIVAGALFDVNNSYAPVLTAVIPLALLGAVFLALVPPAGDPPLKRGADDDAVSGKPALSPK